MRAIDLFSGAGGFTTGAAMAEAEQITRELRASHGLAPAPGTLNCAARGEEECLAYGACGEAGRCVRATCGGKGPDHG